MESEWSAVSFQPSEVPPVPTETERIARIACRRPSPWMVLRDELGPVFEDPLFQDIFKPRGHPALPAWRLALVTVMQFAEDLTDREAADAVRQRIDWKYVLSLELDDPGFDFSVLCEFRQRLVENGNEALLFNRVLKVAVERRLLRKRGRQRTDSTHVLMAVSELSRLELLGEAVLVLLGELAEKAPTWLMTRLKPEWVDRYERRFASRRLPAKSAERSAMLQLVAEDAEYLLGQWRTDPFPTSDPELGAAVKLLTSIWEQQTDPSGTGQVRDNDQLPPNEDLIVSPHDPDGRMSIKRETEWTGYKVHVTETSDDDLPALITDVHTASATEPDFVALPRIQAALEARDLLPAQQLVDRGYTSATNLEASQAKYQVELVGRIANASNWQHRAQNGYAVEDFHIDWKEKVVTCPQGRKSRGWKESIQGDREITRVHFGEKECLACPVRESCTRSPRVGRRLTLPREAQWQALQEARAKQKTAAFQEVYAKRAGIEGTISVAVRTVGLRQARYRRHVMVRLEHLMKATGLNLLRMADFLTEGTAKLRPKTKLQEMLLQARLGHA